MGQDLEQDKENKERPIRQHGPVYLEVHVPILKHVNFLNVFFNGLICDLGHEQIHLQTTALFY